MILARSRRSGALLLIAALAAATACKKGDATTDDSTTPAAGDTSTAAANADGTSQTQLALPVTANAAREGDLIRRVNTTGQIRSDAAVKLRAEVAGTVAQVLVRRAISTAPTSTATSLVSVPIVGVDSLLPQSKNVAVAIDAGGGVVWLEGGTDPLGTLVEYGSKLPQVVRFGRRGRGPGELQNPWFVSLSASGPLIFEPSGRRLMQFARSGRVVSDKVASYVVGISDSRVLSMSLNEAEGLMAFSPDLLQRVLISSPNDSIWRRLHSRALASQNGEPFAAAIRGDTVYLATTTSGEMFRMTPRQRIVAFGPAVPVRLRTVAELDAYVEQAARTMPGPRGESIRPALPADFRSKASRQPLRQTSPMSGLQIDGDGRVWRFRDSPSGPVADVFADTVPLQQVQLPCSPLPRGARIAGRWLILACEDSRANSERDVILHRFRF